MGNSDPGTAYTYTARVGATYSLRKLREAAHLLLPHAGPASDKSDNRSYREQELSGPN